MHLIFVTASCGIADDIANTAKSSENPIISPNSVTYTCNSGYERDSGDASRQCTASGTFAGTNLVCKRKALQDQGGLPDFNFKERTMFQEH